MQQQNPCRQTAMRPCAGVKAAGRVTMGETPWNLFRCYEIHLGFQDFERIRKLYAARSQRVVMRCW